MQVLKAALSIRRQLASLKIHYSNSPNSESQNQSEPK